MTRPNLSILTNPELRTAYDCLRREAKRGKDGVLRVDHPHVTLTLKLGTLPPEAVAHQTALREAFLIHIDPKATKCDIVEEVDEPSIPSAGAEAASSTAASVQGDPQETPKVDAAIPGTTQEELDDRAFRLLSERAALNKQSPGKINGARSLLRRALDVPEDVAQAIIGRLEAAGRMARDTTAKNARNSAWTMRSADAHETPPPVARKTVRVPAAAAHVAKAQKPRGREPTTDVLRELYRKLRRNAQERNGRLVVDARNMEGPGEKADTIRKRLYALRDQGFIESDPSLGWAQTTIVGAERPPRATKAAAPKTERPKVEQVARRTSEEAVGRAWAALVAAKKDRSGRSLVSDPVKVVVKALGGASRSAEKYLSRLEVAKRLKRTQGKSWKEVELLEVRDRAQVPRPVETIQPAPPPPPPPARPADGSLVERRLKEEAERLLAEIARHTDPVVLALLERERLRWLTAVSDLRLERLLPETRAS
jgi:hypothetical protein